MFRRYWRDKTTVRELFFREEERLEGMLKEELKDLRQGQEKKWLLGVHPRSKEDVWIRGLGMRWSSMSNSESR